MAKLQRLADTRKFAIHKVAYKDKTIKVEIREQGVSIVVKGYRPMQSVAVKKPV
jgi:hypothetical protein